jgi:hypothetical protein
MWGRFKFNKVMSFLIDTYNHNYNHNYNHTHNNNIMNSKIPQTPQIPQIPQIHLKEYTEYIDNETFIYVLNTDIKIFKIYYQTNDESIIEDMNERIICFNKMSKEDGFGWICVSIYGFPKIFL